MRGIAAACVCLVHSVAMPVGVGMDNVVPLFAAVGPAGVDLFFVISGFIIATVAVESGARASGFSFGIARDFALKRAARIYPLYWLVFLIALPVSQAIFLAPASMPVRPLWRLFLLVDPDNNKVMVAWTLVYELYFYLVIAGLLIAAPRKIFTGLLVWSAITVAFMMFFAVRHDARGYLVPFSPLLLEFMLGTLIAYLIRRGVNTWPISSLCFGVLAFAVGAFENYNHGSWQPWERTVAFGPASGLIIYGVLACETRFGWTFARPWQRLGDASFSLYIWHQLLFFSMLAISQHIGLFDVVPGAIIVVVWIAIVLAWGLISFRYIETPSRKWLEGRIAFLGRRDPKRPKYYQLAWTAAVLGVIVSLPVAATVLRRERPLEGHSPDAKMSAPGPISDTDVAQVARWPETSGVTPLVLIGKPALQDPAHIVLPPDHPTGTLHVMLNGNGPGALYIGYWKGGKTIATWYEFAAGSKMVLAQIPNATDDGFVWLLRDNARGRVNLESIMLTAQDPDRGLPKSPPPLK